jgi:arylsulfatase A-like enzyme
VSAGVGVACGAALLGAWLAGCGEARTPLSAVLLTLDTTNRDALGCYGQPLPLTPELDHLARAGLVFDEARSVAPLTLPAHASMLTGLVPLRHGVRDNGLAPLAPAAETLPERLGAEGYACAAFVSAVVLAAPFGLDQGFAHYDAPRGARGAGAHFLERSGSATVAAAADWLRARERSRPFFLWVHLFEPHEPYAPPPELLALANGDAYLGEVAALDQVVGELVRVLAAEHGLERLVLLVAGDHGESLGEHGERTHSVLVHERVLRVPFIVRLPDGARAGERMSTPVSLVDVAPTVLAALGLDAPAGLDGRDLLAPPVSGEAFFESYTGYLNYGWSPLAGWSDGVRKYVHGTEPELYDLARDPGEQANLVAARADDVAHARARLSELARRPRLPRVTSSAGAALDERLAADVQALGYAGAGPADVELPEPLADTGLAAPRTRMEELERFYRAVLWHEKGRRSEAVAELEGLLASNPGNTTARVALARFLYQAQEPERALVVLAQLSTAAAERAAVQDLLGHCLERLGRLEEARTHFERALALQPGDAHAEADVTRVQAR